MQDHKHLHFAEGSAAQERTVSDSRRIDSEAALLDVLSGREYLRYLVRRPKFLKALLKAQQRQMRLIADSVERQGDDCVQCVKIAAGCQEQTAAILQHNLERHALDPAVETVVTLADELFRLNQICQKLHDPTEDNSELKTLANELGISARVARDRLSFLGIEHIMPAKGEQIDVKRHSICGHTDTQNKNLHGRIGKSITAGVLYRGRVLQEARVSVFRYIESQNSNRHEVERDSK